MSLGVGRQYKVGLAKETSRGTAATAGTDGFWMGVDTLDVNPMAEVIRDEQTYGTIENVIDTDVANKWSEGTLEGILDSDSFGLLLLSVMGSVSESADDPEAGVNTHTFTVANSNQHQSLSFNVVDEIGGDLIYPLGVIDSLEVTAELNEYVRFSADFFALDEESATLTAGYSSPVQFKAGDISLEYADATAGLGSGTDVNARSVSVVLNQNIERNDILGQDSPDDFITTNFGGTIDITKVYEDDTFKDMFTGGSKKAFRVTMEDTAATLGTGTNPKIEFDLNQVSVTDWSKNYDVDGIVTETFTLELNFKLDDSKMIEGTIINESSY